MEEAEEEQLERAQVHWESQCHHGVMEARREDFRREGSAVSEAAVRPRELEKGVCWVGQSLKRMVVVNGGGGG